VRSYVSRRRARAIVANPEIAGELVIKQARPRVD